MAKQSNATPDKSSMPAAQPGKGGKTIGTKPISKISNGGSVFGKHVGPKNAPVYEK
jgi:hypothetical protein